MLEELARIADALELIAHRLEGIETELSNLNDNLSDTIGVNPISGDSFFCIAGNVSTDDH